MIVTNKTVININVRETQEPTLGRYLKTPGVHLLVQQVFNFGLFCTSTVREYFTMYFNVYCLCAWVSVCVYVRLSECVSSSL